MPISTHRARGILAALVVVLCMALVACGGDDDKSSSSTSDTTAAESTPATTEEAAPEEEAPAEGDSDFVAQANKLCEDANAEIQPLVEAEDVPGIVGRSEQLTSDIAALEPPAEQQETFDALIAAARAHDDEVRRIVEDGGTLEDIGGVESAEADAAAAELGLTACA